MLLCKSLCCCVFAALAAPVFAHTAPPPADAADGATTTTPTSQHGAAAPESARHPTTLGTILVRGARTDDPHAAAAQVPGSVHVIDASALHQRTVTNLADALRYVPGVMATSNAGGDDMVLSIRGSNLNSLNYDNAGVTLFQDGLPVTTADGANHNRMLNPFTAENIIVASGINALRYGASDLGGAIDVISRTARNSNPNQIDLQAGSYGLREAQVSAGGVAGKFDGMVTLDDKHWGGYLRHSREDRNGLTANAGWRVSDRFHLRAFASYSNDRQQLAGALTRAEFDADPRQAQPSYALGNHQLNAKTGRFAVKGTWLINADSQLEFGASYELQRLTHPIVDVFVPVGSGPNPPLADVFSLLINTQQRTSGGMVRYRLHAGDHDVLAGINLTHTTDRGGNYANLAGRRGAQQDIADTRGTSAVLFAVDHWQFAPDWTFVYGAQGVVTHLNDMTVDGVDQGNTTPRDQKNHFSSFNPRVGLIRALGAHTEAFASAGRLYQSPNFFDLDNARMELGPHTNLVAMHGGAYELGLRGHTPDTADGTRWRWSVSGYYERIRHEVFSINDPAKPGLSLTENLPRTTHAGIEALAAASFALPDGAGRIEPLVSATFNDFTFRHDPNYGNNRLPSAPRYVLHGEVMYRSQGGLFAGPTLDVVGRRYADFANTYRVGGHGLVGVRAGIKRTQWQLFAEVRNAFNRRYVAVVEPMNIATADDAVLDAGAPRTVFVGLHMAY